MQERQPASQVPAPVCCYDSKFPLLIEMLSILNKAHAITLLELGYFFKYFFPINKGMIV